MPFTGLTFELRRDLSKYVVLVSLLFEIVVFTLSIATCALAYKKDYGDLGLSDVGVYMIGVTIITSIAGCITCLVHLLQYGLEYPLWFTFLAMFIFRILLCIFSVPLTDNAHLDRMIDISFANWRVDTTYMFYEFEKNCRGLSAVNDSCLTTKESGLDIFQCCDSFFKKDLRTRVLNIRRIDISIIVFSGLSLLLYLGQSIAILKLSLD